MNSCYTFITSLNINQVILANYSHIVPIILSVLLALFVFFRAKFNLFSKIFLFFVITFSTWLIGDLITWTFYNYDLIYASWAPLDFIEIIFYIIGLYFVLVFTNQQDISIFKKILLILLALPAFIITVTKQSVLGFNQPVCEALGSNFLSTYKLIVEIVLLIIMLTSIITPFIKKFTWQRKKASLIMVGSMFLFLLIFGVTEYISSITGVYEYTLYSLFLLPIFLLVIIYAVFELDIFNFQVLGTQYLVIGLVILMVGQLFFVNGMADQLLTIVTIILTIGLSFLLFRNLKKESDQRVRIEKLSIDLEQSKWRLEETNMKLGDANERLKGLDKLKTEFVSLASHQLRSPLTAIKGYSSMLTEGDYGDINPQAMETINRIVESSNNLTLVVDDLLNVSKIEAGGMKYDMIKFDFGELVSKTAKELSVTAEKKGLKLIYNSSAEQKYFINGDQEKLRQVLVNLIDNSMKYTKVGQIEVGLSFDGKGKIILSVKDTGAGISKEAIGTLFKKFSRGDGAKLNSSGSGLGLYLVKEIVEAHKGRVWIESEGLGKGSTFFVEMDEVK
jgi:signal transduction histidine kinase